MQTILAVTVGGSCNPVVTAIKNYTPDFVIFFATTGSRGSLPTIKDPGKPCRQGCGDNVSQEPNILEQSGYKGKYKIVEIKDPDAFADCYESMQQALERYQQQFPGARYIADYTGGTKTMGATLVLAALEKNWQLSLVKGTRADLIKVLNGTEMASLVNSWDVYVQQRMREAENLFNQFAYTSAGELLESLLREKPVRPELEREIRKLVAICRGFDAWDKFDHATAQTLLKPFRADFVPQWRFLHNLNQDSGYAAVFDLLLNAQRRAQRGRYDDAVARLYRALELFAQNRLQNEYQIDSGNVQPERLPDHLRDIYHKKARPSDGKIKIGLVEDYELLRALHDPVGDLYAGQAKKLLNALATRNESILAHGRTPVSQGDFREMYKVVDEFLQEAARKVDFRPNACQFPLRQNNQFVQREQCE